MKSSTEKQSSSAIIVHKPKRTATSTSTLHTRQNKPYRLGAASTGVVGTPTRRCPAATVPADVVFGCRFRCCFAEIAEDKKKAWYYAAAVAEITLQYNEIIHRKTQQLCHHRPQTKAHSYEYEHNIH